MGCDLMAALTGATVPGHTLLGVNLFGPAGEPGGLCVLPAREHATGEMVRHPDHKIPEIRRTAHVLGWQTSGHWGLQVGCNEHNLAAGTTQWRSRLKSSSDGLAGCDIVRLVLERANTARHGVDIATELIERHGQTTPQGDHAFLIADAREAFVLEAAGSHWAQLECQKTRAVSDVALIRQDWQRLSRDLAHQVVANGLWPNDGTKIDVCASLGQQKSGSPSNLKRWSRATLALAQQEGAIDAYCLRRLLFEHFESCQDLLPHQQTWHGTLIFSLPTDAPALAWTSPGHLGMSLFFPLVAAAPMPGVWIDGLPPYHRLWGRDDHRLQETQDSLQAIFDQDAEEFLRDARAAGAGSEIVRRAQEMMNRHAELFVKECQSIRGGASDRPTPRPDEMLAFVTE